MNRARAVVIAIAAIASGAVACSGVRVAHVQAVSRGELPATEVPAGKFGAIIELGDAVIVLGPHRVTVLRGGSIAAVVDATQTWLGGTTIAAPDGDGRWAVGIADDGSLWRVTLAGELEPVADRLGFGDVHAHAIGAAGATTAASIDGGIAATIDGVHLARIEHVAPAAPGAFAVAHGRIAIATPTTVELWDLAAGTETRFPLIGAVRLAFLDAASDAPRVVAANAANVYVETRGSLQLLRGPTAIRDLVAAGARLWIATRAAVYAYDGTTLTQVDGIAGAASATSTAAAAAEPRMFGTAGGELWLAANAKVTRYGIERGATTADTAWQTSIAPVFARVCAHCHLPGGDAGVDLSTPASWVGERDELRRRVLVTQTMPPAGTLLSDDDRAAITAWLGH